MLRTVANGWPVLVVLGIPGLVWLWQLGLALVLLGFLAAAAQIFLAGVARPGLGPGPSHPGSSPPHPTRTDRGLRRLVGAAFKAVAHGETRSPQGRAPLAAARTPRTGSSLSSLEDALEALKAMESRIRAESRTSDAARALLLGLDRPRQGEVDEALDRPSILDSSDAFYRWYLATYGRRLPPSRRPQRDEPGEQWAEMSREKRSRLESEVDDIVKGKLP